jgi:diguanylate cyclase (GGDEF)-like protein
MNFRLRTLARTLKQGDARWLGAIACFAMGVVVSAIDLLITSSAVASRTAFELDVLASAFFLTLLIVFHHRLSDLFFQIVIIVSTGPITMTIGLNPRHTGNEAYYLLIVLYSSYFFTRTRAALQVGLVIAAYGAVTFSGVHDGSAGARWLNLSGVLIVVAGVVMLLKTQLDQLISSLNLAALTDPLTGLLNRRAFEMRIHEEAARSARQGTPLSMLALDIDHFKRVNDRHGHPAGDAVLVSIAEVIAQTARAPDVVARVGGEEFSVLLVDADVEAAQVVAERIRVAVEDATHGHIGRLTIRLGVAGLALEEEAPALTLQRDADRLLYVAKETGRNRVVTGAAGAGSEGSAEAQLALAHGRV